MQLFFNFYKENLFGGVPLMQSLQGFWSSETQLWPLSQMTFWFQPQVITTYRTLCRSKFGFLLHSFSGFCTQNSFQGTKTINVAAFDFCNSKSIDSSNLKFAPHKKYTDMRFLGVKWRAYLKDVRRCNPSYTYIGLHFFRFFNTLLQIFRYNSSCGCGVGSMNIDWIYQH